VLLVVVCCAVTVSTALGHDARRPAGGPGSTGEAARALNPHPLTGQGQNMELVGNVPLRASEGTAGTDLELHGNYAFVGSYGEGMVVIDVSNPRKPRRAGAFRCTGGQNDIQLSPSGKTAVMAIDTKENGCHPGKEGASIIDISNPTRPRELSFIRTSQGAHNTTLDGPNLYIDQPVKRYSKVEVFSLLDRRRPRKIGQLTFGGREGLHDSAVDHRPDGRDLLYGARGRFTDVIDVTRPSRPRLLKRIRDARLEYSHQAETNFDRSLLLVSDEAFEFEEAGECGASGPGSSDELDDTGAVHFYRLNHDGTLAANEPGFGQVGIFNIGREKNDVGHCTIHVFSQAPDENRLVTAWYGRGVRVVDFSRPEAARELGSFVATGADVWAAKAHRGYIFAGDINRGFDVYRYTGENGSRWPATAGRAEVQRRVDQGLASPPR